LHEKEMNPIVFFFKWRCKVVSPISFENSQLELSNAIANRDADKVKLLLQSGALVNAQSNFGNTPLQNAVHDLAITELLLKAGADPNIPNKRKNTPTHLAAELNLKTLEHLIPISNWAQKGENNKSLLHFLSSGNASQYIPKLVSAGIEVDVRDDEGMTPIMAAAEKGREATVHVLISEGANLSLKNKQGKNASTLARENGHIKTSAMLEEAGKFHRCI
jgi:ankyrin repeat protein